MSLLYDDFPLQQGRRVKMLILDVDGVMTEGRVEMDHNGEESKAFSVRDGHGIKMLQRTGIKVAILTGRTSRVVEHRARDLGIEHVVQGSLRKADGLKQLCEEAGIAADACAYMGDDVVDLPAMAACHLTMAPADADRGVLKRVDWVSAYRGGRGAVRQAAEGLILAAGCWERVITEPYGLTPEDCGWPGA
ncbi:MAG: HAD-IIIA family hydrolase [Mariprofundaceae bacterium]|nr:HAD-IIIA family hydrolase [Mariprofundaceae bacterium]